MALVAVVAHHIGTQIGNTTSRHSDLGSLGGGSQINAQHFNCQVVESPASSSTNLGDVVAALIAALVPLLDLHVVSPA